MGREILNKVINILIIGSGLFLVAFSIYAPMAMLKILLITLLIGAISFIYSTIKFKLLKKNKQSD